MFCKRSAHRLGMRSKLQTVGSQSSAIIGNQLLFGVEAGARFGKTHHIRSNVVRRLWWHARPQGKWCSRSTRSSRRPRLLALFRGRRRWGRGIFVFRNVLPIRNRHCVDNREAIAWSCNSAGSLLRRVGLSGVSLGDSARGFYLYTTDQYTCTTR